MIIKHIFCCIDKFLKSAKEKKTSITLINAIKKSANAEYLVDDQSFVENFNFKIFKTI